MADQVQQEANQQTQSTNFSQTMQEKVQATQPAQEPKKVQETHKILNQAISKQRDISLHNDPNTTVLGASAKRRDRKIAKMLRGITSGSRNIKATMKLMLSGKKFSMQQMLIAQSAVYAWSEQISMTSKVVEQAVSSVKTVGQTQV